MSRAEIGFLMGFRYRDATDKPPSYEDVEALKKD